MHPLSARRHFVRGCALASLVSVLMGGCSDSGNGSPEARAKLVAAIDRTVAVRSVHVETSEGFTANQREGSGRSSDYQAPDRLRTNPSGDDPPELGPRVAIIVGTTTYMSAAGLQVDPSGSGEVDLGPSAEGFPPDSAGSGIIRNQLGTYWKTTVPASDARRSPRPIAQNIFGALRLLRTEKDVIAVDSTHFKVHGPHLDATVVVTDGYVTTVVTTTKTSKRARELEPGLGSTFTSTVRYSAFNSAPAVDEPPASAIVPGPPKGKGPSGDPAPVKLPSLPRSFVPSDLQVRRVIDTDASECTDATVNPVPAREADLRDSAGTCYQLAASDFRVTHVAEATASRDPESAIYVNIKLDGPDAPRFDSLMERYLGQQLAIVMFGRVLSTATVNSSESGGRLQISPLDATTAAQVIASLRP